MLVRSLVVGQLQANCHLIIDEVKAVAAIIDPGDDADYITRVMTDEKVTPTHIIATHGHFDHIMATAELQLAFKIPFLVHKKDEFLVNRMRESAKYFTGVEAGPEPKVNGNFNEGQTITVGSGAFAVIETPGHTPGSISLYDKKAGIVLVGDLLFADGGVGRTDFSYSSLADLEGSIGRILRLPEDTVILSGHGPQTTVARERHFHK